MNALESESILCKNELFECFLGQNNDNYPLRHSNSVKILTKEQKKYMNKVFLPIPDTIILDNAQFIGWLFTDKNGYVMRHTSNKLNKVDIFSYFLEGIKRHLAQNGLIKISKVPNKKIVYDIERFSSLIEQKYPLESIFKDPTVGYLSHFYKVKSILTTYADFENKEFVNIIELHRIYSDINKFGNVKMIQNFIGVKIYNNSIYKDLNSIDLQPLIVDYYFKDNKRSFSICLSPFKPLTLICQNEIKNEQISIISQNKSPKISSKPTRKFFLSRASSSPQITSKPSSTTSLLEENYFLPNEMKTAVQSNGLSNYCVKMLNNFISFIEKKKNVIVTHCKFFLIKFENLVNEYCFFSGGDLQGISRINSLYLQNRRALKNGIKSIYNKRVPKDLSNFVKYKPISSKHKCYGEFCEFEIPKNPNGIKSNYQNCLADELSHVPLTNQFTKRDKNYVLPNMFSLFKIKRVYDNPEIVNIILKSYSILPSNLNKDTLLQQIQNEKEEILNKKKNFITNASFQKFKVSLFTNIEKDFNNKNVVLYTPTKNKFEHVNLDNMYEQVGVCHNCFMIYSLIDKYIDNIDQLKNNFLDEKKAESILLEGEKFNPNSPTADETTNVLLQDELKERYLRKAIQIKLNQERNKYINSNSRGSSTFRLEKSKITKQEENSKVFNYKLTVLQKPFKVNLYDDLELDKKMFNVNFSPKEIQEIKKRPSSSATRRMHMGFTSRIFSPKMKFKTINDKTIGKGLISENSIRSIKGGNRETIDIFHTLNILRGNHEDKSLNDKKKKNKINVVSMFYNKNYDANEGIKFYYMTTPMIKLRDPNHLVSNEKIYEQSKTITHKEFATISNSPNLLFMEQTELFLYDNYTAIPYKITTLNPQNEKDEDQSKKDSFIIFIINDFFDSYSKYLPTLRQMLRHIQTQHKEKLGTVKLVSFNLPGQSNTLWSREEKLNNIFYSEFLDRFIYHLYDVKHIFDSSYNGIFIGFGNGGYIALTYLSLYESYCNFIKCCFFLNSYVLNDKYINESFCQIKKYLDNSKHSITYKMRIVSDFIKAFTTKRGKEEIFKKMNSKEDQNNSKEAIEEEEESYEGNTIAGLNDIIKGYKFNIDIRNIQKDSKTKLSGIKSIKTPIIFCNSMDDPFINVLNIESMINFGKNEIVQEEEIEKGFKNFLNSKDNRRFVLVKGTHDMFMRFKNVDILTDIIEQFFINYFIFLKEKKRKDD